MGDAMVGVKECLLVLGKQREHERGCRQQHRFDFVRISWRPRLSWDRSVSKWWRMAHPSSNDGDDGSGQRVWTKRWRALRHFALDRVDKLMERGLGKNVDDHEASCLVGPSAPSILAGVDGPPWKATARAEQGIFCSTHEQAGHQSKENWEQRNQKCNTATALVGRGADGKRRWMDLDFERLD